MNSNDPNTTEFNDISDLIGYWFDRTGNPRHYIFNWEAQQCNYSGAIRSQANRSRVSISYAFSVPIWDSHTQ